ncbi:MAG: hypothetical protein E7439_00895 [Ruminococcaceae bacterium]|nr:hypothetical protein [Oscillospiraceae bacterium]
MRKLALVIAILLLAALPVNAMDYTAPSPPESAEGLMPAETQSFSQGLWELISKGIRLMEPSLAQAGKLCVGLLAIVMLNSVLQNLPGNMKQVVAFVSTMAVAGLLLGQTSSMIHLGRETVQELSDYGKLLLPVLTASLAAQGGVTSATALYAGTAAFDMLLGVVISKLLIPMVYAAIILSVVGSATGMQRLNKLRDFVKWLAAWSLKTVLYVFTGYITITGVVSGSADATALKVTKLTLSGMVPVVGGILSDASEAVLVGAGVMKNAAGIYGLLAILAVGLSPFVKIGAHYLLLKLTAALCGAFDAKEAGGLIQQFSGIMGLLLGMTAAMTMLLMVSTVCFMKGVG